jgi:hypothetical protein
MNKSCCIGLRLWFPEAILTVLFNAYNMLPANIFFCVEDGTFNASAWNPTDYSGLKTAAADLQGSRLPLRQRKYWW